MYAELEAENFPAAEEVVDISLEQSENAFAARRTQARAAAFCGQVER